MTEHVSPAKYRVELPVFRGPLDLLLYLVRKHEVDILDIPIATVTQTYLRYLEVLQLIDIEAVGDFLVMASTLMEIKSRMLLPLETWAEEESAAEDSKIDPRAELVRQLVAYRRFREASAQLELLASEQAAYWPRGQHEKPVQLLDPRQQPVQPVELWDLVSAFDRLLRATLSNQQEAIEADETPQHIYMENLLEHLATSRTPALFEELFQPPFTKARLIGLFLALLELIKLQRILVEQTEPFGQITVTLLTPLHAAA